MDVPRTLPLVLSPGQLRAPERVPFDAATQTQARPRQSLVRVAG